MAEVATLLFPSPGPQNTEAALEAARTRAEALDIAQFVVASSTGGTAVRAAEVLGRQGRVIAVTHSAAHWGQWTAPDQALLTQARGLGVTILACTHAFGGLNFLLEQQGALPPARVMAYTLFTFGQGMKVCVECALMAADAGLLEMEQEVIVLAGTEQGADTAAVIQPAYSNHVFDLRVREIIAKPR